MKKNVIFSIIALLALSTMATSCQKECLVCNEYPNGGYGGSQQGHAGDYVSGQLQWYPSDQYGIGFAGIVARGSYNEWQDLMWYCDIYSYQNVGASARWKEILDMENEYIVDAYYELNGYWTYGRLSSDSTKVEITGVSTDTLWIAQRDSITGEMVKKLPPTR